MEWGKATQVGTQTTYEIPSRWLHIHYFEALNILFRVENSLRIFVFSVLKNTLFDQWTNINISTEDSDNPKTISVVAKRRANQAKGFGYLGYQVACPIMYLTGGELSRLITSDEYWKHFAEHFKGSKDIIRTKLDEINHIRNALAHFRPISQDDVEVIRQNAKQVLAGVERYLAGIAVVVDVVPTNTDGEWYTDFNPVVAECNEHGALLTRKQSADGNWIHLEFEFAATLFSITGTDPYRFYQASKLNTSAILRYLPEVAKFVTRLSESNAYCQIGPAPNYATRCAKRCTFVFRKETIEKNSKTIAECALRLVTKIAEETALVGADNLARGILIQSANFHATLDSEKGTWSVFASELNCPVGEDDAPEYWGNLDFMFVDVIAGAARYPWMATDISQPGFAW